MAFYCKMKLPPLKLTTHPVGSRSKSVIHRGMGTCTEKAVGLRDLCSASSEGSIQATKEARLEPEFGAPVYFPDSSVIDEPTHHELQRRADVKGWEQLRSRFLSVATECSAMPLGQLCVLCPSPAEFRCQECGPFIFYCKDCFCSRHKNVNFFHVAEKWEVQCK